MNESVQRVVSAITSKEDWLPLLEKELGCYNNNQGTNLIQRLFELVVGADISIDALRKLIRFNINRGDEIGRYAQWVELAVAYGNKAALIVMHEDVIDSDPIPSAIMILEAAASMGRERLLFVLEFLNDVTDLEKMFRYYVDETNWVSKELSAEAKLVLTVVSDYLGIDAYTYDWGAEDSVVNQWFLSLKDQV